jgi:uncharacterized membrane protein HdeD (DUF308 family)
MDTDPGPLDVVADPSATDPLSEVTRQERKSLLATCVIAVSIAAGGLVPGEIEALGITVTPAQEKSLLYIVAGVIVYFILGFTIYAISDLNRRKVAEAQARLKIARSMDEAMSRYKEAEAELQGKGFDVLMSDDIFKRVAALSDQAKLAQKVNAIGALRIAFDVWLPIVVGVVSAALVFATTRGFPGWPWVAGFSLFAVVAALVVFLWRRRKDLKRWWNRRKSKWRNWRFKRSMAAANKLPDGDPKKTQLQNKAREALMKSIEEFASGV